MGSMSVSRGEQGESSLRVMVIATSTHSLAQTQSLWNSLRLLTRVLIIPIASRCTSSLCKKKDDTLLLCWLPKTSKGITQKDWYWSHLSQTSSTIGSAKVYSKLDLHAGYSNVRIAASHKWKTAFQTHYDSFEFLVMLMGLTKTPAMFKPSWTTSSEIWLTSS